jgi:hypothetical protein
MNVLLGCRREMAMQRYAAFGTRLYD